MELTMRSIYLNGNWRLKQKKGDIDCAAAVPGDNFSALLNAGIIEDPYYRDNEKNLQWIGQCDWSYSRDFTVDEEMLSSRSIYLNLDGVDTIASVFLNGRKTGNVENMFRRYRLEVKKLLKPGANTISIEICNPWDSAVKAAKKLPIPIPATRNGKYPQQNLLRKVNCHTGWGWAPSLPVSGVYGDVSLHGVNEARIEHVYTLQNHHGSHCKVTAIAEIEPIKTGKVKLNFAFDEVTLVKEVDVIGGQRQEVKAEFNVSKPRLWNPAGFGEQWLYNLEVKTADESRSCRIGLRKIEFITKKDSVGESCLFRVNGREIFCKGANWVPVDALPQRQTRERYAELLEAARKVYMNMLRVWGGGQY